MQWKRAEKRFERLGRIWTLHLEGGVVVRTTGEHPLWVVDAGEWGSVSCLTAGERLLGHDERTFVVEGVADEGVFETVFNLRIEQAHTYFVCGGEAGGWSVWAHNEYNGPEKWRDEYEALPDISKNGRTLKQRYLEHLADKQENASSPTTFANIQLRNWNNAAKVRSFEMVGRQELGAPIGKGSKPEKAGRALPDLPMDQQYFVILESGDGLILHGVTDFKDKIRIYNDKDKHGKTQLQEMFDEANDRGVPMNLIISPATRFIHKSVADFVRKTGGVVLEFDPVTRKFSRVDIGNEIGQSWTRPEV